MKENTDWDEKIPGGGQPFYDFMQEASRRYAHLAILDLQAIRDRYDEVQTELLKAHGSPDRGIRLGVKDPVVYLDENGDPREITGLLPLDRAAQIRELCDAIIWAKEAERDFNLQKCLQPTFRRLAIATDIIMDKIPEDKRQVSTVYQMLAEDNTPVMDVRRDFGRAMPKSEATTEEEKWSLLCDLVRFTKQLSWIGLP